MKREAANGSRVMAILAAIAGWIVPGLGHLLLRRWSKAAVYFLCVGGLAYAGLAMRGGVFGSGAEDLFDRLGFFADLGTGIFYFLAHFRFKRQAPTSPTRRATTAPACSPPRACSIC